MTIDESIDQILKTENLVSGKFYDRFFSECPHLQRFFEGVDMNRQASMLTSAIVLISTMYSRESLGLSPYMRLIGQQHQDRGIKADDYDEWTESMLRTLGEYHGEDWSDTLEQQWREAIGQSVQLMLDGYAE